MEVEKIKGIEVTHAKFGKGIVSDLADGYIKIAFAGDIVKKFRYPDVFEAYIHVDTAEIRKDIMKDIEERHSEQEYAARKKTKEVYEHLESFAKQKKSAHERKKQEQIEKQRQAQKMRELRMQSNGNFQKKK